MHKSLVTICALFLALALALPANAASVTYTTTLKGANEVPPTGSLATGLATVTLNGNLLSVTESFSGLSAPASGAHIHCCAPVGSNAPVAVPFTAFANATSGTYSNTFDLTLAGSYTSAFLALEGGTAAGAEAALIAGLGSGQTYFNIHDATFTGGEIRGLIPAPTPEPAGLLLVGTGMLGIVQAIRRKVRA